MKHKTCISVADRRGNKTEVLKGRRGRLPVMKLNEISLLMPIKAKAYAHQIKAFGFVCGLFGIFNAPFYSRGAALLMEMGCGKTITAIAITGCLYQFEKVNRVLVVAPLGILGVWEEEFERFSAFPFSLTVLKGSMAKKKEQLEEISDEGHKIKSAQTATGKCMHALGDRARYRLLLTGTLITNKEIDVFSQYRFINSEIFGTSFYAFRNRYFDMLGYGNHTSVFRKYLREDFLKKMHSVAYRVTKAECLDLPDITEEVRMVELEQKAMKLYTNLERESYTQMAGSEVSAVNVLTRLLRLSQITSGHLTDDEGDDNAVSTAKLEALSDILDSADSRFDDGVLQLGLFRVEF